MRADGSVETTFEGSVSLQGKHPDDTVFPLTPTAAMPFEEGVWSGVLDWEKGALRIASANIFRDNPGNLT